MIDRSPDPPIAGQAGELGISRGSVYYLPHPNCLAELAPLDYPEGGLPHRGLARGVGPLLKPRDIQHRSRAISSPLPRLRACCSRTTSRSLWMARAPGATMPSSRGPGIRSNTQGANLRACDTFSQARASIGRHLDVDDCRGPHSRLGRRRPDQAFFNPLYLAVA